MNKPLSHFSSSEPKSREGPSKFPRISRNIHELRPEYDVVVIGSGYGAGVAASKLARAGKTVAVLEYGEEMWPGEYPVTTKQVARELRVSGDAGRDDASIKDIQHGKRTGLYDLVLGKGQNVLRGKGLGGTSLINANVFLPADHRTLQISAWPPEIRNDPHSLDIYYKRAAQTLTPTPYPTSYPPLNKLDVLEEQASALGQEHNFYRVPQTTFFHSGLNSVGVEMRASSGSGQDFTGVNDGSKNTVLATYIADAWNWGAEIFCECEVRYVKKDTSRGGYTIHFAWHGKGRDAFADKHMKNLMWVRAKELCILGAGTLGTTSILLRSKKHGLQTSSMVGQKISGNGDILGFAYDSDRIVNGVGTTSPDPARPPGPTITGIIDARDPGSSPNVLDSYVVEEGAIPAALATTLHMRAVIGGNAMDGALNRTQAFLVMAHDNNEGIVTIENDESHLNFVGVGKTRQAQRLRVILDMASQAIGATFVDTPFYADGQKEVSAHPLGGAIMSYDGTGRCGAVDHMGRLFTGEGRDVHEGLVCIDASIIPTSLGANPLATITAFAERNCELLLSQKGWVADQSPNGRLDLFGKPRVSSSRSEKRLGYDGGKIDTDGVRFTDRKSVV